MRTYIEFTNHLTTIGNYSTTNPRRTLFPSLKFYPRLIKIIFHYARLAKGGRFSSQIWGEGCYEVFRVIEKCGGNFNIVGLNNLETIKPPVVFMPNHMSSLENIILPALLLPFTNYQLTFVIKKEILNYPTFKHIMRWTKPIAVGRQNPRDDLILVLTEGHQKLKAGYSIVIYPQATRRRNVQNHEFDSLAAKLANRSEVPLVPVALKTDFWGNNWNSKLLRDFGPIKPKKEIHFSFGQPIVSQDKKTPTKRRYHL